jgi:putative FmdB family regulatory protein
MPVYEYSCAWCGVFEAQRPMSQSSAPHPCPACGAAAERVILTAPGLAMMSTTRRQAHATNEKSAHAPKAMEKEVGHAHGPGCGCGSSSKSAKPKQPRGGRPWMISH